MYKRQEEYIVKRDQTGKEYYSSRKCRITGKTLCEQNLLSIYLTKSEKEILHIHNSSNMSSERLCITRFSWRISDYREKQDCESLYNPKVDFRFPYFRHKAGIMVYCPKRLVNLLCVMVREWESVWNSVLSLTFEHAQQHSVILQGVSLCSGVFFLSPLSTIIDSTERMTAVCVLRGLRVYVIHVQEEGAYLGVCVLRGLRA